jgi:predicted transcriptional regulator
MKNKDKAEEVLAKLFGSTSRAGILTLLFENIGRSFYQREIVFETGLSLQAVQRELSNLVELGILKKRETSAKVYYQEDLRIGPLGGVWSSQRFNLPIT